MIRSVSSISAQRCFEITALLHVVKKAKELRSITTWCSRPVQDPVAHLSDEDVLALLDRRDLHGIAFRDQRLAVLTELLECSLIVPLA
jgi:hypothetical protein